jgi:uncharacterized membrane protein
VFSVWSFRTLPFRYPIHFDFAGHPNRWAKGDSLEWFLLLGIAAVLNAFFFVLANGLRKVDPAIMNVPDKAKFLALPAPRKAVLVEQLATMPLIVAFVVDLMMSALYVMLTEVAHQRMDPPTGAPVVVFVMTLIAVVLGGFVRFRRLLAREIAEARNFDALTPGPSPPRGEGS